MCRRRRTRCECKRRRGHRWCEPCQRDQEAQTPTIITTIQQMYCAFLRHEYSRPSHLSYCSRNTDSCEPQAKSRGRWTQAMDPGYFRVCAEQAWLGFSRLCDCTIVSHCLLCHERGIETHVTSKNAVQFVRTHMQSLMQRIGLDKNWSEKIIVEEATWYENR